MLLTLVSAVVTFYMDSIAGAWKLLLVTGAGTGSVLLLRWYWWRINAWSEVSAMISAFMVSVSLQLGWHLDTDKPVDFAWIMIITVAITTVVWLAATFLTRPEPKKSWPRSIARTRPRRPAGDRSRKLSPDVKPARDGLSNLFDWIAGCVLIYGILFGTGKLLLHETGIGFALIMRACRRRSDLLGSIEKRLERRRRLTWRTHSCVPRRHSWRRMVCVRRGVAKSRDTARTSACATLSQPISLAQSVTYAKSLATAF